MMAQKHLHELLREEQEPFLLNKYISDRRRQMKKRPSLQLKKHFPVNLCRNACLFSIQTATPQNLTKSSPAKSPHLLLLEAALRIQKHSKTKAHTKGFGLLGSLFKKLKNRNKEIEVGHQTNVGFGCSRNGRSSSAVWSESNEEEDKSLETSTSSCSCTHSHQIIHFVTDQIKHGPDCPCCLHHADAHGFCDSPFRFVLQRNTPDLPSPLTQDKESNGGDSLNKFQSGEEEEEEEEDKEQCSPVSVLDPSFDDQGHENEEEEEEEEEDEDEEEGGFDLECSYAIVQRAKQQLLYKLRRFEKLAGLDPIELDKTMLGQEEEDETSFMDEDDFEDEGSESSSREENGFRELVFEALRRSSVHNDRVQIPEGLKKLVSDLTAEEDRELCSSEEDRETVVGRVCKRLELWKEVEANTIDMMIEEDFSREESGWKKNGEQARDMAGELELSIFGFLLEEFSEELEYC